MIIIVKTAVTAKIALNPDIWIRFFGVRNGSNVRIVNQTVFKEAFHYGISILEPDRWQRLMGDKHKDNSVVEER